MTTTVVAEEVRMFIHEHILFDQRAALSVETPLLDLGILDSPALLKLVAHLNDTYAIGLTPDRLDGRDFTSIEAIVRLVAQNAGAAAAGTESSAPRNTPEDIVLFEARESPDLVILFTGGNGDKVEHSLGFFREAGLGDCNLMILRDPDGIGYVAGISKELPSPDAIAGWIERWIGTRSRITNVYSIGVSSGGGMAIWAGHRLAARTVWAFGARTVLPDIRRNAVVRLEAFTKQATGKTIPELQRGMTEDDRERIDRAMTQDVVDYYYASLLDPDRVIDRAQLQRLADTLARDNGVTDTASSTSSGMLSTRQWSMPCAAVPESCRSSWNPTIVPSRPGRSAPGSRSRTG